MSLSRISSRKDGIELNRMKLRSHTILVTDDKIDEDDEDDDGWTSGAFLHKGGESARKINNKKKDDDQLLELINAKKRERMQCMKNYTSDVKDQFVIRIGPDGHPVKKPSLPSLRTRVSGRIPGGMSTKNLSKLFHLAARKTAVPLDGMNELTEDSLEVMKQIVEAELSDIDTANVDTDKDTTTDNDNVHDFPVDVAMHVDPYDMGGSHVSGVAKHHRVSKQAKTKFAKEQLEKEGEGKHEGITYSLLGMAMQMAKPRAKHFWKDARHVLNVLCKELDIAPRKLLRMRFLVARASTRNGKNERGNKEHDHVNMESIPRKGTKTDAQADMQYRRNGVKLDEARMDCDDDVYTKLALTVNLLYIMLEHVDLLNNFDDVHNEWLIRVPVQQSLVAKIQHYLLYLHMTTCALKFITKDTDQFKDYADRDEDMSDEEADKRFAELMALADKVFGDCDKPKTIANALFGICCKFTTEEDVRNCKDIQTMMNSPSSFVDLAGTWIGGREPSQIMESAERQLLDRIRTSGGANKYGKRTTVKLKIDEAWSLCHWQVARMWVRYVRIGDKNRTVSGKGVVSNDTNRFRQSNQEAYSECADNDNRPKGIDLVYARERNRVNIPVVESDEESVESDREEDSEYDDNAFESKYENRSYTSDGSPSSSSENEDDVDDESHDSKCNEDNSHIRQGSCDVRDGHQKGTLRSKPAAPCLLNGKKQVPDKRRRTRTGRRVNIRRKESVLKLPTKRKARTRGASTGRKKKTSLENELCKRKKTNQRSRNKKPARAEESKGKEDDGMKVPGMDFNVSHENDSTKSADNDNTSRPTAGGVDVQKVIETKLKDLHGNDDGTVTEAVNLIIEGVLQKFPSYTHREILDMVACVYVEKRVYGIMTVLYASALDIARRPDRDSLNTLREQLTAQLPDDTDMNVIDASMRKTVKTYFNDQRRKKMQIREMDGIELNDLGDDDKDAGCIGDISQDMEPIDDKSDMDPTLLENKSDEDEDLENEASDDISTNSDDISTASELPCDGVPAIGTLLTAGVEAGTNMLTFDEISTEANDNNNDDTGTSSGNLDSDKDGFTEGTLGDCTRTSLVRGAVPDLSRINPANHAAGEVPVDPMLNLVDAEHKRLRTTVLEQMKILNKSAQEISDQCDDMLCMTKDQLRSVGAKYYAQQPTNEKTRITFDKNDTSNVAQANANSTAGLDNDDAAAGWPNKSMQHDDYMVDGQFDVISYPGSLASMEIMKAFKPTLQILRGNTILMNECSIVDAYVARYLSECKHRMDMLLKSSNMVGKGLGKFIAPIDSPICTTEGFTAVRYLKNGVEMFPSDFDDQMREVDFGRIFKYVVMPMRSAEDSFVHDSKRDPSPGETRSKYACRKDFGMAGLCYHERTVLEKQNGDRGRVKDVIVGRNTFVKFGKEYGPDQVEPLLKDIGVMFDMLAKTMDMIQLKYPEHHPHPFFRNKERFKTFGRPLRDMLYAQDMRNEHCTIQVKLANRGDVTKYHFDSMNCTWLGYDTTGTLGFMFIDSQGYLWSIKFIANSRRLIGDDLIDDLNSLRVGLNRQMLAICQDYFWLYTHHYLSSGRDVSQVIPTPKQYRDMYLNENLPWKLEDLAAPITNGRKSIMVKTFRLIAAVMRDIFFSTVVCGVTGIRNDFPMIVPYMLLELVILSSYLNSPKRFLYLTCSDEVATNGEFIRDFERVTNVSDYYTKAMELYGSYIGGSDARCSATGLDFKSAYLKDINVVGGTMDQVKDLVIEMCDWINNKTFPEDTDFDRKRTVIETDDLRQEVKRVAGMMIPHVQIGEYRLLWILQTCALCGLYLKPHPILNKLVYISESTGGYKLINAKAIRHQKRQGLDAMDNNGYDDVEGTGSNKNNTNGKLPMWKLDYTVRTLSEMVDLNEFDRRSGMDVLCCESQANRREANVVDSLLMGQSLHSLSEFGFPMKKVWSSYQWVPLYDLKPSWEKYCGNSET
jgi:hypothetical protein